MFQKSSRIERKFFIVIFAAKLFKNRLRIVINPAKKYFKLFLAQNCLKNARKLFKNHQKLSEKFFKANFSAILSCSTKFGIFALLCVPQNYLFTKNLLKMTSKSDLRFFWRILAVRRETFLQAPKNNAGNFQNRSCRTGKIRQTKTKSPQMLSRIVPSHLSSCASTFRYSCRHRSAKKGTENRKILYKTACDACWLHHYQSKVWKVFCLKLDKRKSLTVLKWRKKNFFLLKL